MPKFVKTSVAAVVSVVALSGAAPAAVVTLDAVQGDELAGEITCSDSCLGLYGLEDPTLSDSFATVFPQPPGGRGGQSPDRVADFLSSLADTDFETGTRTDLGAGELAGDTDESASFSTDALWVALKLGANYAIVQNTSGSSISISWSKLASGGGFGLSNITEFGEVDGGGGGTPEVIPLPATALLLLGGLGGLAAVGRRRSA